jgi:DNA polymerase-3 subunit gamma/tau
MTLLRMLAFAPDDDQANRVPRSGSAREGITPGGDDLPPGPPAQAGGSSRTPPETAPARVTPAEAGAASAVVWHELVAELPLSGVARMIAEHSELVSSDAEVLRLRLDRGHDTLLSDAPVAAIERALADRGRAVRVEVEVGEVTRETPARRFQRLRAERQQAAEETLATDHTVRSLLREFGGRIDGVSPIE